MSDVRSWDELTNIARDNDKMVGKAVGTAAADIQKTENDAFLRGWR